MTILRGPAQAGMTLIEVMITVLVICVGSLATLGTYAHFTEAASKSRQRSVLTAVAERELEQLRPISFPKLAMASAPDPQASTEAPLTGTAAGEPMATGGVVIPGGPGTSDFTYQGVSGRIYRYVTTYAETCTNLTAKVHSQLATQFGQTQAQLAASLPQLCATTGQTKRLTVVVVPVQGSAASEGVRLSTIVADTSETAPEIQNLASLAVKRVTGGGAPPSTVDPDSSQPLYLTDTRCSAAARDLPSSHETRDTSQADFTCSSSGPAPTLLTLTGIPGTVADPVADFSTDVTRAALGGLVLLRDDKAGSCTDPDNVVYTNADAPTRMHALHTWATTAPGADYETPVSGGRADLSLWSSTADGLRHPARLCVTVRRSATGEVVGSSDFSLRSWPATPTQLDTTFDLSHVSVPAGERLLLTLRVPADSGADLRVLYDHAKYSSSLSVQTRPGRELR